jgi:photosystem II stability/assembly factor-like uncharacterized protein
MCVAAAGSAKATADPAGAELIVSAGSGRGVVIGPMGVSVTDDAGTYWRRISPPSMRRDPVLLGHTFGVAAVGSERVWLLVSANGGYGTRLVYTRDAGRSWRTTPLVPGPDGKPQSFLPGDANPTAPTFMNASDGWLVASLAPNYLSDGLFRTRDGGAHWSFVARTPFQGSVEFTSPREGWAITAPTWTNARTVRAAGGVLYHSTDGGRSWRRIALPGTSRRRAHLSFALPTFFGPTDAVLPGRLESTGNGEQVVVYVTHDDGLNWQRRRTPRNDAISRYQQGFFSVPFTATSASEWFMGAGSILYTTTDAGRTWKTVLPGLPKPMVGIDHLYTANASTLWAQAHSHSRDFYPSYLLRSTDGGRTWKALSP